MLSLKFLKDNFPYHAMDRNLILSHQSKLRILYLKYEVIGVKVNNIIISLLRRENYLRQEIIKICIYSKYDELL